MQVSLAEAATLLERTPRTVRYLILKGRLPAEKKGGQWLIRAEDLPLTAAQRRHLEAERGRLREVVDRVIPPEVDAGLSRRSVRSFQVFSACCRCTETLRATGTLTPVFAAAGLNPLAWLQSAARSLSHSHYSFDPQDRRASMEDSRRALASAQAELALTAAASAGAGVEIATALRQLMDDLDQHVLGPLGAALRSLEEHSRTHRRRR